MSKKPRTLTKLQAIKAVLNGKRIATSYASSAGCYVELHDNQPYYFADYVASNPLDGEFDHCTLKVIPKTPALRAGDENVTVLDDSLEVGCQTITKEQLTLLLPFIEKIVNKKARKPRKKKRAS